MDTIREVFDKLSKLPGTQVNQHRKSLEILFPAAKDADYNFSISLIYDGESQISASHIRNPKSYFWYHPLEKFDFESEEERTTYFYETIKNLLTNSTKIIQKRGLLFWSFKCFYIKNNIWNKLNSPSQLKFFSSPPRKGKEIIYRSMRLYDRI